MPFSTVKYESDTLGIVVQAKMSDAEAAAAGTPPSAAADAGLTVYCSGSRRRHGVHARGLRLSRQVGTAPNTFTKNTFLAQLTLSAFNAVSVGDSVTIGGTSWTVVSKVPEVAK